MMFMIRWRCNNGLDVHELLDFGQLIPSDMVCWRCFQSGQRWATSKCLEFVRRRT